MAGSEKKRGKVIRFVASEDALMRSPLHFTLTPEAICTSIFWEAEETGVRAEPFLASPVKSGRIADLIDAAEGGVTVSMATVDMEDELGGYVVTWVELAAAGVAVYAHYPWRDPAAEDAFSKAAALIGVRAAREFVVGS